MMIKYDWAISLSASHGLLWYFLSNYACWYCLLFTYLRT